MRQKVDRKKSLTIFLLGLIALTSLSVCIFTDLPVITQVGVLLITLTSLLLISDKNNVFRGVVASGDKTVDVSIGSNNNGAVTVEETANPDNNVRVKTVVSTDAIASPDLTNEVIEIRDMLHHVMRSGFNAENSILGLRLLEDHDEVVKDSWLLLLNKASLLGMTGDLTLAESITTDVLARFPHIPKAVGWAYGILSWLVELREPGEKTGPWQFWLAKRTSFVMKAVEADPERHLNQWNAFETWALNENSGKTLRYLKNAYRINPEFTRKKLAALALEKEQFLNETRNLSYRLNKKIDQILKGEEKMSVLKRIKASFLPLCLLVAVSSACVSFYRQAVELPRNVSALAATTQRLEKPLAVLASSCFDGNDLGKITVNFARAFGNDLGK